MMLYCSSCKEMKDENEFTKFDRNPALQSRKGKVCMCKSCCNQLITEQGNTKDALKHVLRLIDVPYIETYVESALKLYQKKRDTTNIIIKKNVYDNTEEVSGMETNNLQTTIYTCYTARLGLMSKKYINFACSDGLRSEDFETKGELTDDEKLVQSANKYLKKTYGEQIFYDKERLAKAVKLSMDEFSLHKNNVTKRQHKFKLKGHIMALLNANELDKSLYGFILEDKESASNTSDGLVEIEVEPKEIKEVAFKVPQDFDVEAMSEKWGYGYTEEQLCAFEKKYQLLKNNYVEKTALHTEGLLTYIRYRVNEEIATARGSVKDAKDWGELASKQATNAKINVSQLSKSDLSDGLDSFGSLVKAVETAVDIIPILPKFKEKPQDSVDFTLLCYINYVRDLKGLPPAEYKDIYAFYDERKKAYEKKEELEDINEENDIDYELGDEDGNS